jgi:hypothetical protein
MNEILHANIFFIIASVGVVIFILLTSLILYHVFKVVKAIRRIVERVERGSEVLAEDIDDIRNNLNPTRLINFVMSFIPGMRK